MQERNNNVTREECVALLNRLKEEKVDPIRALLASEGGSSVSVAEIRGSYSAVKKGFRSQCRGAKDVCDSVFCEFRPVSLLT